jgi:hypothetical protein
MTITWHVVRSGGMLALMEDEGGLAIPSMETVPISRARSLESQVGPLEMIQLFVDNAP